MFITYRVYNQIITKNNQAYFTISETFFVNMCHYSVRVTDAV